MHLSHMSSGFADEERPDWRWILPFVLTRAGEGGPDESMLSWTVLPG